MMVVIRLLSMRGSEVVREYDPEPNRDDIPAVIVYQSEPQSDHRFFRFTHAAYSAEPIVMTFCEVFGEFRS